MWRWWSKTPARGLSKLCTCRLCRSEQPESWKVQVSGDSQSEEGDTGMPGFCLIPNLTFTNSHILCPTPPPRQSWRIVRCLATKWGIPARQRIPPFGETWKSDQSFTGVEAQSAPGLFWGVYTVQERASRVRITRDPDQGRCLGGAGSWEQALGVTRPLSNIKPYPTQVYLPLRKADLE